MITLLLAILAAYRATQMLYFEDGPFDAFTELRTRLNVEKQDTWWRRGLACPDCISFWAACLAAALTGPETLAQFVLWWGGVAGGAFILNRLFPAEYFKQKG